MTVSGDSVSRSGLGLALCGGLLALVACAPALNWREVKVEATGAIVQMPCRPDKYARQITLAQRARTLNLLSCSTSDATWGISWIEDVPPGELGETLAALRMSALSNVGSKDTVPAEFLVPGSMSHPAVGRLRTQGQRPDGSPVTQELVLFAKGLTVFQATILAVPTQASVADEFFGALRFKP